MTSCTRTIRMELCVDGEPIEREVELQYEYYHEEFGERGHRWAPYCVLEAVMDGDTNRLNAMTPAAVIEIEADLLRYERNQAEEARTERRIAELEVA